LLSERLAGDLDARITGRLGHLVVGTGNMGGVKDVTEMLNHADVVLGPMDPCMSFLIEEPLM
jgi:hypothetical protein